VRHPIRADQTSEHGNLIFSTQYADPMRLVLLGTTGYHPNDRRHTACMMLPESGAILDAGTAMFRARDYLATPTLDIFLTHVHLDHVIGLSFLFDVLHERQVDRVTIHGEAEKLAAVQRHLFAPELFPAQIPAEFEPLTERVELPDGGTVTHFPLKHPGGALGYRIDWPDRAMAYVTDTTAATDADYIEAVRGVDVLLHECYFTDDRREWAAKTGHSCATPVAQLARTADVGRLVLVHINPLADDDTPYELDRLQTIFPATQIGVDRMVIDF
jgi:ribonuclease BN (tRNA processing enzyme)